MDAGTPGGTGTGAHRRVSPAMNPLQDFSSAADTDGGATGGAGTGADGRVSPATIPASRSAANKNHPFAAQDRDSRDGNNAALTRISKESTEQAQKRATLEPNAAVESSRGRGYKNIRKVKRGSRQPSPVSDDSSGAFMSTKKKTRGCASQTRVTRASSQRGGAQATTARRGVREEQTSKPRRSRARTVRFEDTDTTAPAEPTVRHSRSNNPKTVQVQKINSRCCPSTMLGVLRSLNQRQHDYVKSKGFSSLFEMTVPALESRGLLYWLMEHIDPDDMTIKTGPGKSLEITKDVIHKILGLPKSGVLPEIPSWNEGVAEGIRFRQEVGLGTGPVTWEMMKVEVEKGDHDERTMRCLFLILFNRFLFCKGANITNDQIYWTRQIEHFDEFDWCQLVYNDLCYSVQKWHSRDKDPNKTPTVYGCALVILLFYLDHLYDNHAQSEIGTPRIKYFDKERWEGLIKADQKDGGWGKCYFRSRTQTCYDQGQSVFIPRLLPLLRHKITLCPEPLARKFHEFLSFYDCQTNTIATSWDAARREHAQLQVKLSVEFSDMIGQILHAQGADDASNGAATQGNIEKEYPDPSLAAQGPKAAATTLPGEVPSLSTDCSNIQNEGGNRDNADTCPNPTVHMDELPEDEPTNSVGYSNLESINSQCMNTTRRGREYDINSSQYIQGETEDQGIMQTQGNVDKCNHDLAHNQAHEHTNLQENVHEVCSPPRHVVTNVQNSPVEVSCSNITSPTRYLNLSNTQGRAPATPSSTSLFHGDVSATEQMERACRRIYQETDLDADLEMGDNICDHGAQKSAIVRTKTNDGSLDHGVDMMEDAHVDANNNSPSACAQQGTHLNAHAAACDIARLNINSQAPDDERQPCQILDTPENQPTPLTQGPPIFDQTPVMPRPIFDQTPIFDSTPHGNDQSLRSAPVLVAGDKPPCFNFDIAKCRELRSIFLAADCTFDSEVVMNFGGSYAKRKDVAESFADKTSAEQLFMEFFIDTLMHDDKFRDGSIAILDMSSSSLLNWENLWIADDPNAKDFNKKEVIQGLKKYLPDDMKNCKILYVPILHRKHWFLLVVNSPAAVVEILDCFPYAAVGTDPYDKFNDTVKMEGKLYKWAPRLIARMSSTLHEVRPKIGLPKFGRWDFRLVKNLPQMVSDSNDCAFYTMLFMKFYDPKKGVLTRSINQEVPGDLRCQVLTYLVYHECNGVDSLPHAVDALRQ